MRERPDASQAGSPAGTLNCKRHVTAHTVIPALERKTQQNCWKSEAILVYTVRPSLKIKRKRKRTETAGVVLSGGVGFRSTTYVRV